MTIAKLLARTTGVGAVLVALTLGGAVIGEPSAATAATTPVDTTIGLVSTNPNANYGAAGNIVATVRSITASAGVPTGDVDFFIDGGWYWNAPLDSKGKARLALADIYPAFYPGSYTITANYNGDATHNPSSTTVPLVQTLVGISEPPVTTLTLAASGLPVFNPRSFSLSSANPVGCNITVLNSTPVAQALAYGTPGNWKRLPGGNIAAGTARGVGVGLSNFTGYFTTVANTKNYVAIHCH